MKALTDQNFEAAVAGQTVVIDFYADWCGPCKSFSPVFAKVAGQYPDLLFAKVDTDANPGLSQAFGISSIPTLVVLRNGKVLSSTSGAMNEAALRKTIDKALAGPKRMVFKF